MLMLTLMVALTLCLREPICRSLSRWRFFNAPSPHGWLTPIWPSTWRSLLMPRLLPLASPYGSGNILGPPDVPSRPTDFRSPGARGGRPRRTQQLMGSKLIARGSLPESRSDRNPATGCCSLEGVFVCGALFVFWTFFFFDLVMVSCICIRDETSHRQAKAARLSRLV